MKTFPIFIMFFSINSFAQQEIKPKNDSLDLNKFQVSWNETNNYFDEIDLNVRIKSLERDTLEERVEKQKRNEGLKYSQILARDIVEGVVGGIFNGIFNKN